MCVFLGRDAAGLPIGFYFDLVCVLLVRVCACVCVCVCANTIQCLSQAVQALLIPRPGARRLD